MSRVIAVRFRLCGLVLLLALVALVGCGKGTGHVTGTVTYKGQLITSGAVVFYGADGNADSGRIDRKGTYTVAQAPSGKVKVAVLPAKARRESGPPVSRATGQPKDPPAKDGDDIAPAAPSGGKAAFPEKYADPETTPLTFTVSGGKQTFDIELTD
jgi:hypothetical protein